MRTQHKSETRPGEFLRIHFHPPPTKTEHLSTKTNVLFLFIQAAGLAHHHGKAVDIISPYGAVSHHAPACIFLRLDDILGIRIDDIPQQVADDIQGYALIYLR